MKLMIVDDQGNAHEVVSNLEDYNLEKPLAGASILADIRDTLRALESR
jgi:hypothetical protein